jgi:aspartate/methionine/tyrosine aminotransferase
MNKSETVPTLLPKKQRAIVKSSKLDNVCYDIRGPVLREAHRLEEEGHKVYKLNIGNPAPWGFEAPEEILRDVIHNIPGAQGGYAVLPEARYRRRRRRRCLHRQRRFRTRRHRHAGAGRRR